MEEIKKRLEEIVERLYGIKTEVNVTPAPANTGADYATNLAMQLAKTVHKAPMVIAEVIADAFSGQPNVKVEIAQPGFLNFTMAEDSVMEQVQGFADNLEKSIECNSYRGKTVVAEFSDPNPFKVLHVGHLYTSIVGDSISRLLEFAGAKVVRANFGGDVGLHVSKTLWSIAKHLLASGSVDLSSSEDSDPVQLGNNSQSTDAPLNTWSHDLTIEDIARCYVDGTRAYEEDEVAKAEITKLNKEIYRINAEDAHDSELAKLYWHGRELSYQYFEEFYNRIGLKFDKYYPESSVADRGVYEVKAHTGTTYEESDGAIVYRGEKVGLHTRVFINREGVPTYETKDVGLIFTKWDDWHFDESIVVTGNEQSDYMKVVLASVSEYAPQLVERTTHLTHGLVKLQGNVKMSSRKGNFLKAVDVLEIVEDNLKTMSDSSKQESGDEILVLAAIKYAFLKYKMGGDIIFNPRESVSTTGNSGIYLLYSAVRAKKILQKCSAESNEGELNSEEQKYVKGLSKKILQYREIIAEAICEKAPYKVCNYLYELAQEFSRFYEHVKVAGGHREVELATVVRAYLNVMLHGLDLLGIMVPEEM